MTTPEPKQTILIVDDTRTALQFGKMVLSRLGYEVLTASGGQEALTVVRAHRPDLVLLDLRMPDLDGIACLRELKGDAATSALPVVMLTTEEDRQLVKEAFAAGCDGYLLKPLDERRLQLKLRELLTLRTARRDLESLLHIKDR